MIIPSTTIRLARLEDADQDAYLTVLLESGMDTLQSPTPFEATKDQAWDLVGENLLSLLSVEPRSSAG